MSGLRLSLISRHIHPKRISAQAVTAEEHSPTSWNLPRRVMELKDGEKITVRGMVKGDMPAFINIARERGMVDCAESDISCAMMCSNFIGLVAENSDGVVIAAGGAMKYEPNLFVIGRLGVVPAYRKKGVTTQMKIYLLEHSYVYVANGYELFIYGVKENISFFATLSLEEDSQYGSFWRGIVKFTDTFLKAEIENGISIRELVPEDFQELYQYDESVHTVNRKELLHATCIHADSRTFIALRDNKICGYGILRKCFLSHKVAPLFADSPSVARSLYRQIAVESPTGGTLSMSITNLNKGMMDIIKENYFDATDELCRNRQTDNPSSEGFGINYNKVFSLTGFSFTLC